MFPAERDGVLLLSFNVLRRIPTACVTEDARRYNNMNRDRDGEEKRVNVRRKGVRSNAVGGQGRSSERASGVLINHPKILFLTRRIFFNQ